MDGVEQELQEQCRDIFYDALPNRIETAVRAVGGGELIDLVRGDHSLISVLYGVPPIDPKRVLIYPVRTYELIREAKRGHSDSGNK